MYQRVGTYEGRTTLQELAARHQRFGFTSEPSGYETSAVHAERIRDAYPELASVLPGTWATAMLAIVHKGGNIPVHRDALEGVRHHLVLQTNDRCWNYHDGDWQQLELGGIYTVDPSKEHASINFGDSLRVHLVVDVIAAMVAA